MSRIQERSPTDVAERLFGSLDGMALRTEEEKQQRVIAEYLRAALCNMTSGGYDQQLGGAVYTSRLTRAVRRQLAVVWPHIWINSGRALPTEDEPEEPKPDNPVRWVLEQLALLGDVVHLGEGYWMPVPLKLVRIPGTEQVAVISGSQTRHLSKRLLNVNVAGYGRVIEEGHIQKPLLESGRWQDYPRWVGWIPEDMRGWTEGETRRLLVHGSASSPQFLDFELCLTSPRLFYRVGRSWLPAQSITGDVDGVFLCRTRKPRRYFLGAFNRGQLQLELSIANEYATWLQLGLQLRDGRPPTARWDGEDLLLYPPPPAAIQRHLRLYSHVIPVESRKVVRVSHRFRGVVEHLLGQHGYRVSERGGTHS